MKITQGEFLKEFVGGGKGPGVLAWKTHQNVRTDGHTRDLLIDGDYEFPERLRGVGAIHHAKGRVVAAL